jgi:hypothetical protein
VANIIGETTMQKFNAKDHVEKVGTWNVFEEDNVEIRKYLESQKRNPNKVYPFLVKTEAEKEVVDHNHRFWRAVYVRLIEGLVNKGACDHSFDTVEEILFSLPDVDVGGTLDFYMNIGGCCDCEVLFNVYSDTPNRKKSGY